MSFKYCLSVLLLLSVLAFANPEAGRDYLVLPTNASTQDLQDPHKVKVIEFFSYGCPACFKLESHLDKWLQTKPKNIIFERIPVVFEPGWESYAKTYLILSELHKDNLSSKIFLAIHLDNLDLSNKNAMAAFLNSHGIKKETYLNLYDSPAIDMKLSQDKKIASNYMVFQIPGIVINGKYKVDLSLSGTNYDKLFATVNYLIRPTPTAGAGLSDGQKHTG